MEFIRLKGSLLAAVTACACLGISACGSSSSSSSAGSASSSGDVAAAKDTKLPTVTLQLKWFTQAQFGGYIAAEAQGFYKQQGLNVDIINGSPDIVSEDKVAEGDTDYSVAWVPDALEARETVGNIVDIAQIYQRAGLQEYTLKKSGITDAAGFKGKKIGVNGAGNDVDVLAALSKAGLTTKQVDLVQENGNVKGLLTGDLDAAQGANYNELGQLLSTENPATGKLYTMSDFNVIDWAKLGTGMLEDGLWANESKLKDSATYRKETQEFVTASLEGWIYCRDEPVDCRNDVVRAGSQLGASLQLFQVNGVNQLVWPAPQGIGMVNPTTWNQTVKIALQTKETDGKPLLAKAPAPGAYDMTYVKHALTYLKGKGLDVDGNSWKPISVTLKPNGQ